MPVQEQKVKPNRISQKEAEEMAAKAAEEQAAVEDAQSKETSLKDTEDLLDEIDGLLEEQEVLTGYRQQGGQ